MIETHARACATRKRLFFKPYARLQKTDQILEVFCGSLPSMTIIAFVIFIHSSRRGFRQAVTFSPAYRRNPYSLIGIPVSLEDETYLCHQGRISKKTPTPSSQRESWHEFFCPPISLSVPVYQPSSMSRVSIPLQYSAFNPPDVLRSKSPSRASMAPWPERGT